MATVTFIKLLLKTVLPRIDCLKSWKMVSKRLNLLVFVSLLGPAICRKEYDPLFKAYYKSESRLDEIPRDIPRGTLELYLNDNNIAVLPRKGFSWLENLSKLYLDHNHVSIIETRAFKGLDALDYLYLNNNEIQALKSSTFRGLKELRTLSLTYNRISVIPAGTFDRLTKLETLYLGNNQLTRLRRDMWFGLYSLTGLHLENNQIRTIDKRTFAKLPKLEQLNLDNNELDSLSDKMFSLKRHGQQVELWLGDNPMNCDCRMCWLKRAEKQGSVKFSFGFQYPDCTNHQGKYWETVQLDCDRSDPAQAQRCEYQKLQSVINKIPSA